MRGRSIVALVAWVAACSGQGSVGPTERLRAFGPEEAPIAKSGVAAEQGGWRVVRDGAGPVRLFEVATTGLEQTVLTYRAQLKAEGVVGKAYLEMWVRVPGRGEFFSRGLAQPLQGSSDWASHEIPFFLNERGVRADLVKLNVAFEGGGGTLWVKDVELLRADLAG